MTDVVVTFVDGRDPEWRRAYAESLGVPTLEKRYRDWGLLKYLLRGIQCNMPFVGNVHLVVS
ncbi:MAG: capsular biosynthesis protein, partial [Bacteroidales bacterium]|nr:capsular biosynthesis protein [Bacteroidales bacterium]